MNPFLHPAVATPLEPEDIPIWRRDKAVPIPENDEDPGAADPAGTHAGEPAGPGPGRRGSGRRVQARCPAGAPAWRKPSGWRGGFRSLALVGLVGLGAWTGTMAQPAQVNANVATAAELETIKGIGPKTARNIISERQRSGLFESFQDFSERIRGIGAKRAASLRAAGLVIGPPVSQPPVSVPAGPGSGDAPVGVLVR